MACSKIKQEVEIGSEVEKDILCAACKSDGDHKPAVKYCLDCNEPICQHCVDSHRRIKQIKGHTLVDHVTEDTLKLAEFLSTTIKCPKHSDKTIELQCKDHNVMCCLTCATVDHRNCRQVLEVSGQAASTNIDSITQDLINDLTSACGHMKKIVKQHENANAAVHDQVTDKIPGQLQDLRKRINHFLNELERRILAATETEKAKLTANANQEIERWSSQIKLAADASQLLKTVHKSGSRIHQYIAVNNVQNTLGNIDGEISCQGNQVVAPSIVFNYGQSFQTILNASPPQIASLTVQNGFTQLGQYRRGRHDNQYGQYKRGRHDNQYGTLFFGAVDMFPQTKQQANYPNIIGNHTIDF